jgi:hypothetical protein
MKFQHLFCLQGWDQKLNVLKNVDGAGKQKSADPQEVG